VTDTGGQSATLKRWLHCFESVTSVVFVVALSDYDIYVKGETGVMRLQESLRLFEEVINSKWFQSTPFILLLNKKDLFDEKIKRNGLNICFPDYEAGLINARDKEMEFIKRKLLELNRVCLLIPVEGIRLCFLTLKQQRSVDIYPHVTRAIETQNIRIVFVAMKQILLSV